MKVFIIRETDNRELCFVGVCKNNDCLEKILKSLSIYNPRKTACIYEEDITDEFGKEIKKNIENGLKNYILAAYWADHNHNGRWYTIDYPKCLRIVSDAIGPMNTHLFFFPAA